MTGVIAEQMLMAAAAPPAPPLPTPIGTMDFVNGNYTLNNVSYTASQVVDTPARIVSSKGLSSITGTPIQLIGDFLTALLTMNWTIVIRFNYFPAANGRSYLMTVYDYLFGSQFALYTNGDLEGNEDSNTGLTRSIYTDPTGVYLGLNIGAWTRTDPEIAVCLDGTIPFLDDTLIHVSDWFNPPSQVQMADGGFTTGDLIGYIEKIDIYPAQDPAMLPRLTAGPVLTLGWFNRTANTVGSLAGNGVACSETGAWLFMVGSGAGASISHDNGLTWSATDTGFSGARSMPVSSANGKVLAAVSGANTIRRSTDGGTTWSTTTISGLASIGSIDISSDGAHIVLGDIASSTTSNVWISSDSGATFAVKTAFGTGKWNFVSMCQNGGHIYANNNLGVLVHSSNNGTSATVITPSGSGGIWGIASAESQNYLVAAGLNGHLWYTSNSGGAWTQLAALPDGSTSGAKQIVCSSTLSNILYLSQLSNTPYLSEDSGATWTAQTDLPSTLWSRASMSDFAGLMAICDAGTQIWTGQFGTYVQ